MKNLALRAGLAVLGVVVLLAWWTLRGDNRDTNSKTENRIPAKVWEGGATLTIELGTSHATRMHAAFGGEDRSPGYAFGLALELDNLTNPGDF